MILKSATATAGMGIWRAIKLMIKNGLGLCPGCLYRFLIIVIMGLMSSIMSIIAIPLRALFFHRIPLRDDPIFIVGHWRTGSTYLHELLALDPRLAAPTTLLCTAPDTFPLSTLIFGPFFYITTYGKRPMDNVHIGPYSPQEDEFALFRLTGHSPLIGMLYPASDGRYFLDNPGTFLPEDKNNRQRWSKAIKSVLRTVQGIRGRRPVVKNPFHTLRIPHLRKLFPAASFIHIKRDPLKVIPSTMRMWSIIGRDNILKGKWTSPSLEEVVTFYNKLEAAAQDGLADLPEQQQVTISFDELEQDPLEILKHIYDRLQLTITPELIKRWEKRIQANKRYKQNQYQLSNEDKRYIRSKIG